MTEKERKGKENSERHGLQLYREVIEWDTSEK